MNGFGGRDDIDDIAVDPTDGRMYAVLNNAGGADELVTVDKTTGVLTDVAPFTFVDVEGLSFVIDGSLHASLSPERARAAIEASWAEPHPMALMMGNEGMVMLYTPRTLAELDTIFQLIVDSYNYVTGRAITADAIRAAYRLSDNLMHTRCEVF